jgi:multicomponent Na+:H+ antiporter subunit G
MSPTEVMGVFALGFGVFFCVVGIVGMLRLPDVYSRIHASGKVSALGVVGLLVGAALLMPSVTPRVIVFTLLLVITSPVASHAIATAAYRQNIPPIAAVRDDLNGRENVS